LSLSMLFRNVWIKMCTHEEINTHIKPHKLHLKTVSILAPKKDYQQYQIKLISAGVVRIKPPHEMSEVVLGESHDGMYPLRRYSRIVEIYHR